MGRGEEPLPVPARRSATFACLREAATAEAEHAGVNEGRDGRMDRRGNQKQEFDGTLRVVLRGLRSLHCHKGWK